MREWIENDGLNCLKIKLRGNDQEWDYQRLVKIGGIAQEMNVAHLTTDFNCTVTDPDYVNQILDRLKQEFPQTYELILYVEQPFPYDLESNQIDVHSVSSRKPLFMDESAHDWKHVMLGRDLGWNGVALKPARHKQVLYFLFAVGQVTRNGFDGTRPNQPYACSNSTCLIGSSCRNDYGS